MLQLCSAAVLLFLLETAAPASKPPLHPMLSEPIVAALVGAVVVGLFTFLGALLAGWTLRKHKVRESGARTELSLNVDVTVRVLPIVEGDVDAGVILETRVDVCNNSTRVCCVPAVYVLAHALVRTGLEHDYLGESDFDNLPECGKLSEARNVAHFEGTIVQVAPDEIERFVRWDTLDQPFVEAFPVVVLNVEVFGASADDLVEDHSGKQVKSGRHRHHWIRLMDSDAGVRHKYQIFTRWRPTGHTQEQSFKPNQRALLRPDGQYDIENSIRFKSVIDTVVQWSRHTTVDLRRMEQKVATKRNTGGLR
jgi:hypothetical protein